MPINVFTTIDDPAGTIGTTLAFDINNLGQIVGQFADAAGTHGFLLSAGTFTAIDVPSATGSDTRALAINDTGQIVGSFTRGNSHSFLLSGGRFHSHR
jgi:probable HAF family extracellular repeat protein